MSAIPMHAGVLLVYTLAAAFYGSGLALRSPGMAFRGRVCFLLALALHTAAIGAYCIQAQVSPFATSFGTLSVAAWSLALVYVPVEVFTGTTALGALASPACCLLLFTSLLRYASPGKDYKDRVVSVHVMVILISFALFALAACCAVFYLWQYSVLKHPDRRATYKKLPPLETVDNIAYHLVAFALPLLTVGLALGITNAALGGLKGNWLLDPHTLMSIAAWLVYAAYLAARLIAGWRGARLHYLLIAGMTVTIALYFIPTSTHRFKPEQPRIAIVEQDDAHRLSEGDIRREGSSS